MEKTVKTVPTVSVVIATYNGAEYLEEQLKSIAAQSYLPKEVIIGDDCSQDETVLIVSKFRESVPFFVNVIERKDRLGFRNNFLLTALEATGDLIAFCDQDDVWREDKLERCAECFVDPRVCLVTHQAELIDADGNYIGEFKQGITQTRTLPPLSKDPWLTFWGFSMVFRRELLDACDIGERFVDFIDPRHAIAHDRWIMFLAQILGNTVEIAEPLASYRQHGTNLFGAGKHSVSQSLPLRSRAYAKAAQRMVEIVRGLPSTTESVFPAFRRQAAHTFFLAAERHANLRLSLHTGRQGLSALFHIAKGTVRGGYYLPNGVGMRWRSMVRDLVFAFKGR